ncbi:MAG: SRPBCC domain-containing protein [Cyclobacteriaceae bacterium]
MKTALLFDFTVDKKTRTVNVQREFNAPLDLVWDAWTKSEILDQWWAPKPYQNKTKTMDFREGGQWLYCMISPEEQVHWCKNDYLKIDPKTSFTGLDAFCDEEGVTNTDMPRTEWKNSFAETDGITKVTVVATYDKLEDLEMVIQMGFQEGFTMGLNQLEEVLKELTS